MVTPLLPRPPEGMPLTPGTGMFRSQSPYLGIFVASETHHFNPMFSSRDPHNFFENLHFKLNFLRFWQSLTSLHTNVQHKGLYLLNKIFEYPPPSRGCSFTTVQTQKDNYSFMSFFNVYTKFILSICNMYKLIQT